jgi:hypothetical protein
MLSFGQLKLLAHAVQFFPLHASGVAISSSTSSVCAPSIYDFCTYHQGLHLVLVIFGQKYRGSRFTPAIATEIIDLVSGQLKRFCGYYGKI